jgi:hypothetical protein
MPLEGIRPSTAMVSGSNAIMLNLYLREVNHVSQDSGALGRVEGG